MLVPQNSICLLTSGAILQMITLLYHIFLKKTLTGAMYNDFLQNTLPQFLKDVDLATRQRL